MDGAAGNLGCIGEESTGGEEDGSSDGGGDELEHWGKVAVLREAVKS